MLPLSSRKASAALSQWDNAPTSYCLTPTLSSTSPTLAASAASPCAVSGYRDQISTLCFARCDRMIQEHPPQSIAKHAADRMSIPTLGGGISPDGCSAAITGARTLEKYSLSSRQPRP